jgi:pyruvate dehydrogenase E2 component (dihydrolipoamide acetyltransferase)
LRPPDLAGGTFTISNLGMYNVDAFSAIIIPPQSAILAIGHITDRVVAFEGKPAIRPMFTLTLSADHRVIDGARAALFLDELVQAIQAPGKWLE